MDGPLPFLFGMPPEKAKKRYAMKIERKDANSVVLMVTPLLQQDAANWRSAKVQLDLNEFLPRAVMLIDPAGNMETTYRFENLEINKKQNIFAKYLGVEENVFKPKFPDYRTNLIQPGDNAAGPPAKGTNYKPGAATAGKVPSVLFMPYSSAADILKKAGYVVRYELGETAPQSEVAHTVYSQEPKANTPLEKGKAVRITYYQYDRTSSKPPSSEKPSRN